ncbi:MAG: Lrp/AsnC family transcriptional regulator [Candidatus Nanoarchaeia archaeon]|nr:Lrp/AsnC family transcriptional regulator [Candidatus Nanoarchaeia archaeon]
MLKKKELLILSRLRQNSRESLTKMSRATRIPVSTIYDRLQACQKSIILKNTSLINFSKLGFNAVVNIMLKVNREKRDEVKDYLEKHKSINSIYKINNGFDYMVEGIFKSVKQVDEFVDSLESRFPIESREIYYVVEDIKRESFLSNENSLELVF